MHQANQTSSTSGEHRLPANFPDHSPEMLLIIAILQALRAAEEIPGRGAHRKVFQQVVSQVNCLARLPIKLCPETVALRRATAGAQAVLAQVMLAS